MNGINIRKLSNAAMYVGAALQHELPICNGNGPSSTIRVLQYKTKFTDIRIYCRLADEKLVRSYWNVANKDEPTQDFVYNRMFADAQHYRYCYLSMKEFLSPEEWNCLKLPADYPELLCESIEEIDTYISEKEKIASKNFEHVDYLLKRWSVNNLDEFRKHLYKVCNFKLFYTHGKNSLVHRHTFGFFARSKIDSLL